MIIYQTERGRWMGLTPAAEALQVTVGHLSEIVRGHRRSRKIKKKMKMLGIEVKPYEGIGRASPAIGTAHQDELAGAEPSHQEQWRITALRNIRRMRDERKI